MRKIIFLFLLLFTFINISAQMPSHTEARLVCSEGSIEPGMSFLLGVEFKMDENWHIYWKNPGEAGMATSLKFTAPEGFEISEILWPYPHNFVAGGIANFGYEKEVILIAKVKSPAKLEGNKFKFGARADWLECNEACLPGNAELSLSLENARGKHSMQSPDKSKLGMYLSRVPKTDSKFHVSSVRSSDEFSIAFFSTQFAGSTPVHAEFFPFEGGVFSASSDQQFLFKEGRIKLRLELEKLRVKDPSRIYGVLVWESKNGEKTDHHSVVINSIID